MFYSTTNMLHKTTNITYQQKCFNKQIYVAINSIFFALNKYIAIITYLLHLRTNMLR